MYVPKIGDYLKIMTDDEVKDFVVINFGEYFRKVAESLYIFLTTPDEVEKYATIKDDTIKFF